MVRFLKRWRDVHGDGSIASIVLQVLAARRLATQAGSDAELVTNTLTSMQALLADSPAAPEIPNPVLETEDLADRWDDDDYAKFRVELDEAVALASEALHSADLKASHDSWHELFGDDFPAAPEKVTVHPRNAGPPPPPDYPDARQQAPVDERYG